MINIRKFINKIISTIVLNTPLFWCWDCDKVRLRGNKGKTHCMNCFYNKCHMCEIDCFEYDEHGICPCAHIQCVDELLAYEELD